MQCLLGCIVGIRVQSGLHTTIPALPRADGFGPGASIVACPPENPSVAAASGAGARPRIPRTAVGAEPLESRQLTATSGRRACALVPCTTIVGKPLEDGEMSALSSALKGRRVPGAASATQPPQDL